MPIGNNVGQIAICYDMRPVMRGIIGNSIPKRCRCVIASSACFRLMFPYALIPSTTAMASLSPEGRKIGILAGANVVMPNLSPITVRDVYSLYNRKENTGIEAAEGLPLLEEELATIGYEIDYGRGDYGL